MVRALQEGETSNLIINYQQASTARETIHHAVQSSERFFIGCCTYNKRVKHVQPPQFLEKVAG